MLKNKKLLIGILLIVILVVGGWWIWGGRLEVVQLPETEYQEVIENSLTIPEGWKKPSPTGPEEKPVVWDAPREVVERYLPVWKNLFMNKNGITESYFDQHIKIVDTGLSTEQSRSFMGSDKERGQEYFDILYRIKVDWIEFNGIGRLAIREKNREEYLTPSEIEANVDFQESVAKFVPMEKPNLTFKEAVQKLKQIAPDGRYIKPEYLQHSPVYFFHPSSGLCYIDDGSILLFGRGTINYRANSCVEGYINLLTGKGCAEETWCWIE